MHSEGRLLDQLSDIKVIGPYRQYPCCAFVCPAVDCANNYGGRRSLAHTERARWRFDSNCTQSLSSWVTLVLVEGEWAKSPQCTGCVEILFLKHEISCEEGRLGPI